MEIKSVTAPALSEEGIKRLMAFTEPKRMTSNSTLFDAGYEQAKRDFREKIMAEAIIPGSTKTLRQQAVENAGQQFPTRELSARRASDTHAARPWWRF